MGRGIVTRFPCLLLLVAQSRGQQNSDDVLSYVDPLIGTDNGGNVFAGATLRM